MQKIQLFTALGIIVIGLPMMLGCGAAPPDSTPQDATAGEVSTTATAEPEYLFVQDAQSTSIADGVLRMGDVNPTTIYFSDRPDRIAGHMTTEEFVATWAEGEDSFASNPPNATLSILTGPEPQEIVVVLTEPRLEEGDLVYNVSILEGATAAEGGAASLFIDIIGRPLTPLSVAGVARRTTRREVLFR